MRLFTGILLAVLAACQTAPGRNDIDFARGCWVSKAEPGGPVTGFLRLLPPEPGANALYGVSQTVNGAMMRDRFRFELLRDGSGLTVGWPDGTRESARREPGGPVVFVLPGGARTIALEGGAERLAIVQRRADGTQEDLFRGERDGCD
jgi:hypothetical protein